MLTDKDRALLTYLIDNTKSGKVRWKPTASPTEFVVPLRGKFSAYIKRGNDNLDRMRLENSDGDVMLSIHESQDSDVVDLYELARRNAYNVDKAIDEIVSSEPEDLPL
jgi:hypothetical protein